MQEIISTLEDCNEEQAQIIASIIDKYIKETTQPLQSRNIAILLAEEVDRVSLQLEDLSSNNILVS